MKKIMILLACLLFLTGCSSSIEYDQPEGTIADMSGYNGLESEQFIEADWQDVIQLAEDKKTTIIYIGFDTCPWCNALIPVLNEVSIEKEMKVYYVNYHSEENYENIDGLKAVEELCSEFLQEDEDGEYVFYFPSVIYMQLGEVVDIHVATVSGHDATTSAMTEKQTARLKYVLEKEFDSIFKK